MNQRNQYQPADYVKVLADMVAMCGLGEETRTNTKDLAASIDASESVVSRLRTFAERVGGLQIRFEGNYVDGKLRGRSSHWRFIHDADWMVKRASDIWGFEGLDNHELDHKMPKNGEPNVRSSGGPRVTKSVGKATTPAREEETQIQAEMKKVRAQIAEPEALIEAINQYRNREAFIEAEIARFHDMGIEIDRSAIKYEPNDAYEQMIPLVEFIEKLQGAIERMGAKKGANTRQADLDQAKRERDAYKEDLRLARKAMKQSESHETSLLKIVQISLY